jgi:hypothetical protein
MCMCVTTFCQLDLDNYTLDNKYVYRPIYLCTHSHSTTINTITCICAMFIVVCTRMYIGPGIVCTHSVALSSLILATHRQSAGGSRLLLVGVPQLTVAASNGPRSETAPLRLDPAGTQAQRRRGPGAGAQVAALHQSSRFSIAECSVVDAYCAHSLLTIVTLILSNRSPNAY